MVVEAGESPVKKASDKPQLSHTGGMFRLTEWAARNVDSKRKRRGLGQLKPRKKNPIKQILANSTCLSLACAFVAPLERARIIL